MDLYIQLDKKVQSSGENKAELSPEDLGLLYSIGIEKGKDFRPDSRMTAILTQAAQVAFATAQAHEQKL